MKYTRLTKEQFEELHREFAEFLAVQGIDKIKWEELKTEEPEIVEQHLDIFSDIIWESALDKSEFLEHYSKNHIFLFRFTENQAESVVIYCTNPNIDLLTQEGLVWLSKNISSDQIEIKQGHKSFEDKNSAIFTLIRQGALITNGNLYKQIKIALGI